MWWGGRGLDPFIKSLHVHLIIHQLSTQPTAKKNVIALDVALTSPTRLLSVASSRVRIESPFSPTDRLTNVCNPLLCLLCVRLGGWGANILDEPKRFGDLFLMQRFAIYFGAIGLGQ